MSENKLKANNKSVNDRELNYEVLRILAMLMIVGLHYLSRSGAISNPENPDMSVVGYVSWLLEAFFLVATNVYVLISGYFGVEAGNNRKEKRFGILLKPLNVWVQVWFYSVVIGFGAFIVGAQQFDVYQFINYILPITREHYWFATSYVILCLFVPFLNYGFDKLEKKDIKALLLVMLIIFCFSKTFIPIQFPWDKYGYDFSWFVVLYITGAYIKKYGISAINGKGRALVLYIASCMVIYLSFFTIRLIYLRYGILEDQINYGYTYNFLFCYLGAIGLFMLFKNYNTDKSTQEIGTRVPEWLKSVVLRFSRATFGVYLIHEHINIRSNWIKLFNTEEALAGSTIGFLFNFIVAVLSVYCVCSVIDIVRALLFEKISKLIK